jgi:DNA repair exonuclease SbcCD ATPase subunit
MAKRIANAQDEDGWDEENAALCDLIAENRLERASDVSKYISVVQKPEPSCVCVRGCSPPLPLRALCRGCRSAVNSQQYIRYKSYLEKQAMGVGIRKERQELRERRTQLKEEHVELAQERAARRASEARQMRKFMELRESCITAAGKTQREVEARRARLKQMEVRRHKAKVKHRVTEARGLDARLDASEKAQDDLERQQAGMMRLDIADALRESREQQTSARKQQATFVRETRRQAANDRSARAQSEVENRARAHREEQAMRRYQKEEAEQEYLNSARSSRSATLATRKSAKAKAEHVLRQKAADAERIRQMTGELFSFETASANIAQNKQRVADAYATRYVNGEAASEWMHSPLHRLHSTLRHAVDAAGNLASSFSARSPFHATAQSPAAGVAV